MGRYGSEYLNDPLPNAAADAKRQCQGLCTFVIWWLRYQKGDILSSVHSGFHVTHRTSDQENR